MTTNIIIRKDAIAIVTESLALAVLEHEGTVNIDVKPGGIAVVMEDGASAEEIARMLGHDP